MNGRQIWLGCQLLARRRGAAGRFLLLALLLAAVLAAAILYRRTVALELAQKRLATVAAERAIQRPSGVRPTLPQAGLQTFMTTLTPSRETADFLAMAWKTAEAEGVQLSRADYRLERDTKGRFTRMNIVMPVAGSYPAIRHYAFRLLAAHAGLALARMELKRERSSDAAVDAELHFILFVRES